MANRGDGNNLLNRLQGFMYSCKALLPVPSPHFSRFRKSGVIMKYRYRLVEMSSQLTYRWTGNPIVES